MAVQSGDVIFRCRPYAYVFYEEEHKKRCHFCVTRSNKLVTCSGCRLLNYCNSKCQDLDSTFHRLECQCLQNMAPDCPSIMSRLLLRLVIRMQTDDHHKMFGENKIFQRRFIDLMSHYDDLQNDDVSYNRTEMMRYTKNCVDLPSHETLMEMFGKVVTNSFTIPDEYLAKVGIGIYLSTSILNHSCAPNATVGYEGLEQIVYAFSDIPQVGPDKVFISYIDMNYTSWQRRDRLWKCYYFYCQCHWCEDEAPYIDRIMTSALCPVKGCSGFTGMSRDNSGFYKVMPCSVCGKKEFSFDYEQMVRKMWTYGHECCNKLEKLENDKDFEGVLSLAEKVLQEFDKSILYESNLLYIKVREFAIGACTELGLWTKAAEYGEKVWPHKMKCLPNVNFTIGLLLVELGKFYLNDHNIPEARRVFSDAKNLITNGRGLNNDTYKEILQLSDECDEIEALLNSGIVTGDATKKANMKQVLSRIKSKISKVLPRRFRIQVPSLFASQHSHTKKS